MNNSDVPQKWKPRVIREFKRIQQQCENEEKNAWVQNCELANKDIHSFQKELPVIKWSTPAKGTKKTPIYKLNAVAPLPPMNTWVPLNQNIMMKDDHLPYLGNDMVKENGKFLQELVSDNGGNLHGAKEPFFMKATGYVELVDALMRSCAEEMADVPNGSEKENETRDQTPFPLPIIFQAISASFPITRGTSPQELKEKYIELTNQKDAAEPASARSENNFATLMCRRCFKYACFLHPQKKEHAGLDVQNSIKLDIQSNSNSQKRRRKERCGNTCFMAQNIEEKPASKNDTWAADEELLIRSLFKLYSDDYCTIASIVQNKTCADIYNFAQEKFDMSNLKELHTPPSKKKKKQPNRFAGCRCKTNCNTTRCSCFLAARECNPDMCKGCGAAEFNTTNITCRNVSIQCGWQKKLLLAPSEISGWGVFSKDGAKKDEFICEFRGEIISQTEANKRDATKFGNKIRFANHSSNPNCYARTITVNGDDCLGIFAQRKIDPDEELTLDYKYDSKHLYLLNS